MANLLDPLIQPVRLDSGQLTDKIKEAIKEAGSLSGGLKALASNSTFMAGVAVGAFTLLSVAIKKGITDFISLSNEIRGVQQITGQSADEASRFVQVLDDLKVSTSDVDKATKQLAQQGLSMNIETLAKLSDEYLKLAPGVERVNFLTDNFGAKTGKQFAETMEQGGEALLRMNGEVSKALILNQKQLESARALESQFDSLKDSGMGLSSSFGAYMAPALEAIIGLLVDATDESGNFFAELANERTISIEMSRLLKEQGYFTGLLNTATKEQVEAIRAQAIENINAAGSQGELTDAIVQTKEEIEEITRVNNEFISSLLDVANQNKQFRETEEELKQTESELLAEKQKLISEGYDSQSEAILDIDSKLADNQTSMDENIQKHLEWRNAKILDLLLIRLSVDGLRDAELDFYLKTGVALGTFSEDDRLATMEIIENANRLQDEFTETDDAIQNLADKSKDDIVFNVKINQIGNIPDLSNLSGGSGVIHRRASGGSVIQGQTYSVSEFYKPEVFTAPSSGRIDPKQESTVTRLDIDYSSLARFLAVEIAKVVG